MKPRLENPLAARRETYRTPSTGRVGVSYPSTFEHRMAEQLLDQVRDLFEGQIVGAL